MALQSDLLSSVREIFPPHVLVLLGPCGVIIYSCVLRVRIRIHNTYISYIVCVGSRTKGSKDDCEEDDEGEESTPTSSSFLRQIDEILSRCPDKGVQRGLFSATLGSFVRELASNFLVNPVTVSVGTENAGANTIDQRLIFVGREDGKLLAVRQLVQQGERQ